MKLSRSTRRIVRAAIFAAVRGAAASLGAAAASGLVYLGVWLLTHIHA